jgi:uncharacterized membrane protein (UPF0127 family)
MSSRTRVSRAAKTASAPKRRWWAAAIALALLLVVAIARTASAPDIVSADCSQPYAHDATVTIRDRKFFAEVAGTEAARARGLSGRECIPADTMMLFSYERDGEYCFWMKDMKFPIDIVWVDKQGYIVQIKYDFEPESYPTTYCPEVPSRYVLEMGKGVANKLELADGDQVIITDR